MKSEANEIKSKHWNSKDKGSIQWLTSDDFLENPPSSYTRDYSVLESVGSIFKKVCAGVDRDLSAA